LLTIHLFPLVLDMLRHLLGSVAMVLLFAPSLFSQAAISVQSTFVVASAYEARGKTFTDGPVVQLSVDLARTLGKVALSAGAWGNVESVRPDGVGELSMLGERAPGLSEVDLWLEATRAVGLLDATVAALYFLYPVGFDFSDASPIPEVMVRLGARVPGSPEVAAYYDFVAEGWYFVARGQYEAAPLGRFRPRVKLEAAGTVGQCEPGEYYGSDGPTHVGVVLGGDWSAGRWTVTPQLGWTVALDELTRPGALREGGRHKLRIGTAFTWSRD